MAERGTYSKEDWRLLCQAAKSSPDWEHMAWETAESLRWPVGETPVENSVQLYESGRLHMHFLDVAFRYALGKIERQALGKLVLGMD